MNYRHSYHVGCFADVFKHIILIALFEKLASKETAFAYLDTHAGVGLYDLFNEKTQKTREYENGIIKLIHHSNAPTLIQRYLDCVSQFNLNSETLRYYPGSPAIAKQLMRSQDRSMLCEWHPEEYQTLKRYFFHDKNVAVHHQNGYQALKSLLPPKERRGIILIDPPYEKPDELMQVGAHIAQALQKFATGVYALWYPIKERRAIDRFHQTLRDQIKQPILIAELSIYPETSNTQLNGNGMAIINPPFQLEQTLQDVLPWLWKTLSENKQGHYSLHPL